MEDKTNYDSWLLLKTLTEKESLLDQLNESGYSLKSSSLVRQGEDIDCKLVWNCLEKGIISGKFYLSVSQSGFINMAISREDANNLFYVDSFIRDHIPKHMNLFDLKNYNGNLEQSVVAFYSDLNKFLKSELKLYLTGKKWIEMEVDWGDYK